MKTESQTPDPLADAAQVLEHAMADAQRAIAAARVAPAPVALALAQCQKQCAARQNKIDDLVGLTSRQRTKLTMAASVIDGLRKDKAKVACEQLTERMV